MTKVDPIRPWITRGRGETAGVVRTPRLCRPARDDRGGAPDTADARTRQVNVVERHTRPPRMSVQ
jgi:hypothetical protein